MNKKKYNKKTFCLLPILITVLILAGVVYNTAMVSERRSWRAEILNEGWYLLSNGEQIAVNFSETLSCEPGEEIVLYNDSLDAEAAGKMLTTHGAQYGLQIFLDDDLLYQYEETYFPGNTQMKSKVNCDASLPDTFTGGTIRLVYQAPDSGEIQLTPVRIGSETEIFIQHITDAGATLTIAVVFGLLGIIALGMAVCLKIYGMKERAVFDASLFLLISSVWFMTDTTLVQQYAASSSLVGVFSYYSFMLMPIPMLYLVKDTGNMNKYRALDILIGLFYANAILQGILYLGMEIHFLRMLFVTHLLLVVTVVLIMMLTIREYRQSGDRVLRKIIIAFSAIALSCMLALLLYWLFQFPYYGGIFSAGILIFVAVILSGLIHSMARNFHYRTEMLIYQEMAKKDWMTGLGNRLPFDEYLSKIQNQEIECNRMSLIFMDLNRLKEVNDEFGHAAGDELILGATSCIQKVFGEAGSCYRLGGDEFAVIMKDAPGTAEEWFSRLDDEIAVFNRNNRFRLSIARGWSELRGEDGLYKPVSDWKQEADSKMYEDKGRTIRI